MSSRDIAWKSSQDQPIDAGATKSTFDDRQPRLSIVRRKKETSGDKIPNCGTIGATWKGRPRDQDSTIGRWVLRYAPELNRRVRREIRQPNRSWRVDETYIRVGGVWTYLYRAVDSAGETIDFMLSPKRDAVAAKHFLQMAFRRAGGSTARDQC
jgi:hypothetical protein